MRQRIPKLTRDHVLDAASRAGALLEQALPSIGRESGKRNEASAIIRQRGPDVLPPEFYERYAARFNKQFFFKNLVKCMLAIYSVQTQPAFEGPIIDVGSGAGPFAIAWSLTVDSADPILLVDRSEFQLALAKYFAKVLKLSNLRYLRSEYKDISRFRGGTRLFSYWWCEQPKALFTRKRITECLAESTCLVVDYAEVIRPLREATEHDYDAIALEDLIRVPRNLSRFIRDSDVRFVGLLLQPKAKRVDQR